MYFFHEELARANRAEFAEQVRHARRRQWLAAARRKSRRTSPRTSRWAERLALKVRLTLARSL